MIYWIDQENNLHVRLLKSIWNRMVQLCADSYPHECGGILIGEYNDNLKQAKITKIMISQNSTGGRMNFLRESKETNNFLKKLWHFVSGARYFIGEWHSHPNGNGVTSSLDDNSMYQVAKTAKCSCRRPILIILNGGPLNWHADSCWVYFSEGKKVELHRQI